MGKGEPACSPVTYPTASILTGPGMAGLKRMDLKSLVRSRAPHAELSE